MKKRALMAMCGTIAAAVGAAAPAHAGTTFYFNANQTYTLFAPTDAAFEDLSVVGNLKMRFEAHTQLQPICQQILKVNPLVKVFGLRRRLNKIITQLLGKNELTQ